MEVHLIHYTPLSVCADAIRTCWNSQDKGGHYEMPTSNLITADKDLIERVANKMKHESVKNHIHFTFFIEGITTKTLLALTRHDVGVEFSVQSTRYTTKKCVTNGTASYTQSQNATVNYYLEQIENFIRDCVNQNISNDEISLLLPQAWHYNLTCTMSLTAVQHFLDLRTKKDAHWDIQTLAHHIYNAVPDEAKYLVADYVHQPN